MSNRRKIEAKLLSYITNPEESGREWMNKEFLKGLVIEFLQIPFNDLTCE